MTTKFQRLKALAIKANELVEKERKRLSVNCKHTEIVDYHWEHDNGYGRQSKMLGKKCLICYKICLWNNDNWSSNVNY